MRKSFTINQLSKSERPREKILQGSSLYLSDKELLAAILGKGFSGESVLVTAERLLAHFKTLDKILKAPVQELASIRGIGLAKAAQLKAVLEIGRRIYKFEGQRENKAHPFLKWAGGKSQLLEQYAPFFPQKYNKYLEPMLGGGAIFFYLTPQKAILSDLNADLMNCYEAIKKNIGALINILKHYQFRHCKEFYYKIRDQYNTRVLNSIERAAAFIYLNKTCYNGLYRVNSKGEFNVPFGNYKNPSIFDEKNLQAVSKCLKKAELFTMSFERVLDFAQPDDFVYFDPPYYPLSKTSNFTSYTQEIFLEREQMKLSEVFKELDRKGCLVMLSNSNTEFIKSLYKEYRIEIVKANRFISCVGEKRGSVIELLILNY